MHKLRFGRKLSLPSTIAIKHQVRTLMAQYEVKRAEVDAEVDIVRKQLGLAVPSAMAANEISD